MAIQLLMNPVIERTDAGSRGSHGAKLQTAAALVGFAVSWFASVPIMASETFTREADKAVAVKRVLAGRALRLSVDQQMAKREIHLCKAFLKDFRTQSGIVHVEPVARAERYDNPVFKPFRDRCPGMELNLTWHHLPARAWKAEEEFRQSLPESERERFIEATSRKFLGTKNFKMYVVDIDNDPANGKENVFYSEEYYSLNDLMPWMFRFENVPRSVDWNDLIPPENVPDGAERYPGGYNVFDLSRCEMLEHLQVTPEIDHAPGPNKDLVERKRFATNSIIKYGGKTYVYDLAYAFNLSKEKKKGYALTLHKYFERSRGLHTVCFFTEIDNP